MRIPVAGLIAVHVLLSLGGCAASRSSGSPAKSVARYDQYIARTVRSDELPRCTLGSLRTGEARDVRLPGVELNLNLPVTFQYAQGAARAREVHFPEGDWRYGAEWLPGIVVEAGAPWIDVVSGGAREPRRFLAATHRHGYAPVALTDGWEMVRMEECLDRIGTQPARVLLFTARHPQRGEEYGLAAYARSVRSGSPWISVLALGPDQAAQAEFITILRSAH